MPLQSVEELIEKMEKDKSIVLSKNEYLTKYLLVGYDIEGRNWSRHVRLDSAIVRDGAGNILETRRNITEAELAQLRGYSDKETSNAKRNAFRDKLLRMGAMYLSDSLYLLPLKVVRDEKGNELDITGAEGFLEAWGADQEVNLHVMGFSLESRKSIEGVSKAFKKVLTDRFDEMEKHLESAHNKLLDLADQIATDPTKTLRGIHRIVEAMDKQVIDAQELINRYSENEEEARKHQFNLSKLTSLKKDIEQAYSRLVEMKENQK